MNIDALDTITPTILIIDDLPANLRQLSELVTEAGYRAMPAQDGATALKAVVKVTPDLILLDIRMPDMNGFEVCARFKADAALKDIPVIFISALGDAEDKVKAFEVGGVDYITKPFQHAETLARINTHLELRRIRLSLQYSLGQQISHKGESLQKISLAVAHQLRNPMTIISGFAELLLKESGLKHPRCDYLEGIKCAARRIESVIQAVHDYAALHITNWHEFYLPDFVEHVRAAADRTAAGLCKTVDWTIEVEPLRFHADENLLFQALCETLTNSIEAFNGEKGAIALRVSRVNRSLRIEISDDGRGIPEEELAYVLDPFYTTKTVGVGMGLAKASRIAQEHYGNLAIRSKPGQGATVELTIGPKPGE